MSDLCKNRFLSDLAAYSRQRPLRILQRGRGTRNEQLQLTFFSLTAMSKAKEPSVRYNCGTLRTFIRPRHLATDIGRVN